MTDITKQADEYLASMSSERELPEYWDLSDYEPDPGTHYKTLADVPEWMVQLALEMAVKAAETGESDGT